MKNLLIRTRTISLINMSKVKTYSRGQQAKTDTTSDLWDEVCSSKVPTKFSTTSKPVRAAAVAAVATSTRPKRTAAPKKSKETAASVVTKPKTLKLFENSDSSDDKHQDTVSTRSASSRSNSSNNNASVSATASAIVDSANSTQMGSSSTLGPATSFSSQPKSIMKSTKSQLTESVTSQQPAKKRNVKIMDEISNKPDDILSNLKPDNKTKYKASTSTPSGLRRKPLKAPTDVSFIMKP